MVNAYLYFNALLYALLALCCTVFPQTTASAVGYQVLSKSGQSEYLVIYGGLQLGMAFLFAYFAWTRQPRNGLVLALAFYVPIVLYRSFTLAQLWPVEATTMLLAGLEWVLLGVAALLCTRLRGRK
ncbi:MAG: DUF4345 domain-containing protein [Pseudoxanthomonas sp.]